MLQHQTEMRQLEIALRENRHIKDRELSQMLKISVGACSFHYLVLDITKLLLKRIITSY